MISVQRLQKKFSLNISGVGLTSITLASALSAFITSPAEAATTYKLNYSTVSGTGSLTGSITIDTMDPAAQNSHTAAPIPAWVQDISLAYDDGMMTYNYTKSDYTQFWWIPNNPGTVNWLSDLVSQFQDINFGPITFSTLVGAQGNPLLMSDATNMNQYQLNPVPGPLPIFGALGVYGWSRQLRQRQRTAQRKSID
jgi:hypothetical protein